MKYYKSDSIFLTLHLQTPPNWKVKTVITTISVTWSPEDVAKDKTKEEKVLRKAGSACYQWSMVLARVSAL
jgi:hypothetical protein